ncbi:MAG: sulfatase-like hydrolase/transferase [Deltaproteobacteria bacterium]|nr:sulfatase-like hydrolase/transferase [Deltaproteobacteria bacterium]MBW2398146.1 sulfatase-like hydrolase/transferase [Deltaproteobacteria bacterium]
MSNRLFARRLFFIVVATGLILGGVAVQVDIRTNPRPLGGPDEIASLAARDDLNLLFVLIDTLRADRLSAYGYRRETSPNIDALAATGVRFAENLSQSSWTKCSMASLWTGSYPARTGVTRAPQVISENARMPAEILKDAGFRTYAIWRNGWIRPGFGFSQGFEVYHSPRATPVPASVRRERPAASIVGTDQDTIHSAIEFLRTHGNERWFLYLHLMDVHQYVYDENSALFGTTYSDIYDNSIRWTDRVLGSLIDELDARGLREKTLVVLAADHGEAFGEHGREGHARDVYGEVTTTPLIVSFPFRLEPGVVVESPSENVDLWPTLLDLLGLSPLEDPDGRSRRPELLAAVRGEPAPANESLRFSHIDQSWGRSARKPRPMVSVSEGSYRLFRKEGADSPELFDRSTDPYEQVDLALERPEVLARMTQLAEDYLARSPADWAGGADVEIDPKELEQLRALGYQVE